MKILCITMGPDWPLAKAEFDRVGLTVEPFQAIVEDNRVLAFNKSVYQCMLAGTRISADFDENNILSNPKVKYEDLLLFEDDVMFDISHAKLWGYLSRDVPDDFMTLHLGCNIIGTDTTVWTMPEKVPHMSWIAKLNNCWQSHATLYSAECVKYIIENFKYVTDEYKTEGCQIFDEWLRVNVLPMGRSYVLNPMIAYQRPRHSEIWNCASDYTGAHKQGNEWLKNNL